MKVLFFALTVSFFVFACQKSNDSGGGNNNSNPGNPATLTTLAIGNITANSATSGLTVFLCVASGIRRRL